MRPSAAIAAARRGFTLIEVMIVVAVIVILATLMLAIRPSNPDGLASGQRMMADMLRIARVQALANRGAVPAPAGLAPGSTWTPSNFRYRLLIKCDPSDPDTHLREMVVAIGFNGVDGGADGGKYVWFSPEAPSRLPPGVFFVPPNLAVANGMSGSSSPAVTMPSGTTLNGAVLTGSPTYPRTSSLPALGDVTGLVSGSQEYCNPGSRSQGTMMLYSPQATPFEGSSPVYYNDSKHSVPSGARFWYYVELGPDGSNNHVAKVVLMLAEGANTGTSVVLSAPDKFAAILVRRNGDVSLTNDTTDFDSATSNLLK